MSPELKALANNLMLDTSDSFPTVLIDTFKLLKIGPKYLGLVYNHPSSILKLITPTKWLLYKTLKEPKVLDTLGKEDAVKQRI